MLDVDRGFRLYDEGDETDDQEKRGVDVFRLHRRCALHIRTPTPECAPPGMKSWSRTPIRITVVLPPAIFLAA